MTHLFRILAYPTSAHLHRSPTKMSSHDTPDDSNRWYLCRESELKRGTWECAYEKDLANHAQKYGYFTNPRSLAVPIPRWMPEAVDFMIINNALKQTFSIKK